MTTQFIALWAQNKSSEKRLLRVAIHLNMSTLYEQYKLTIICFYRDKIVSYCRHLSTVSWENDGSSLWPIRTWRHRVTQAVKGILEHSWESHPHNELACRKRILNEAKGTLGYQTLRFGVIPDKSNKTLTVDGDVVTLLQAQSETTPHSKKRTKIQPNTPVECTGNYHNIKTKQVTREQYAPLSWNPCRTAHADN